MAGSGSPFRGFYTQVSPKDTESLIAFEAQESQGVSPDFTGFPTQRPQATGSRQVDIEDSFHAMEELRSSPLLGELHRSVLRKSRTSKRKARKKITQVAAMNCQMESDLEFHWSGHDSHGPGKRFRQDSDSNNFSDLPDIPSAREPSEQCPETNSHRRSLRIAARPDFVVAQEERTPLPKKKIPGCGMAYDDI